MLIKDCRFYWTSLFPMFFFSRNLFFNFICSPFWFSLQHIGHLLLQGLFHHPDALVDLLVVLLEQREDDLCEDEVCPIILYGRHAPHQEEALGEQVAGEEVDEGV